MRFSAALVLALAAGAASAAEPGAVALPFAPPVNVDIGYACSAQRSLGGRDLNVSARQVLRFAGSGGERRLTATLTALDVAGDEPVRSLMAGWLGIARGQPVEVSLSADGAAIAVTNEAQLRAAVRAAAPGLRAQASALLAPAPAASREVLQSLLDAELAALDAPDSAAFTARWLDSIEPLLGGEAPLVPGAMTETSAEAESPFGGALRYTLRYGLTDYVPGRSARLVHTMTADPADVQRLAAQLVAQLFPDATPGQNEATATLAILSQMTAVTEISSDISLPSGVRTRFATHTTVTLPGRPARREGRDCTLATPAVIKYP